MMSDIISTFGRVELNALALFLLWVVAHFFAEPMRWYAYRHAARAGHVEPYFQIFALSAFLSMTLPLKLGLPARIALLRWKAHLDFATITALLALDGLIYYGGWAVSAAIAVVWFSYAWSWQGLGWPLLALLGLLSFSIWRRRRRSAPQLSLDEREVSGWRQKLLRVREICSALSPRILVLAVMIVAADIASQVARHAALLEMFDVHLSWAQIFTIVALSFFAGLASLMPLGLGGYDVTLVYLLTQAGVPSHTGVAIVVANRLGSILVSIVLGGWSGWMLGVNPLRREWLRKAPTKEVSDQ